MYDPLMDFDRTQVNDDESAGRWVAIDGDLLNQRYVSDAMLDALTAFVTTWYMRRKLMLDDMRRDSGLAA